MILPIRQAKASKSSKSSKRSRKNRKHKGGYTAVTKPASHMNHSTKDHMVIKGGYAAHDKYNHSIVHPASTEIHTEFQKPIKQQSAGAIYSFDLNDKIGGMPANIALNGTQDGDCPNFSALDLGFANYGLTKGGGECKKQYKKGKTSRKSKSSRVSKKHNKSKSHKSHKSRKSH